MVENILVSRPFDTIITNSIFTIFPNNFDDVDTSLGQLAPLSCDPVGMAWSPDNSTLYLSDAHTRNISKCVYSMDDMDVSSCSTLLHLPSVEGLASEVKPAGLAVDSSNHLWVAVAGNDGAGAVLELDTETGDIVSNIGEISKLHKEQS